MGDNDENTKLWRKVTQLEGDLKAMAERVSHVEESRSDIKEVKDALEQLKNESSHRAGAKSERKWIIATIISLLGLAFALGRIVLNM